jgi:hypothetical protein
MGMHVSNPRAQPCSRRFQSSFEEGYERADFRLLSETCCLMSCQQFRVFFCSHIKNASDIVLRKEETLSKVFVTWKNQDAVAV